VSYWPPHLPRSLAPAPITLPQCLDASAARHPERTAIAFFGQDISYRRLQHEVEAFAGWLRHRAGVKPGDRVILYMQNSPQWVIAYYGVLRADAIVVPVNPMNRAAELQRYIEDSGAEVAVCSQELVEFAQGRVREIVVATYADYLPSQPAFDLPDWITVPPRVISGCHAWAAVIAANETPLTSLAQPVDLAILNYTSGSSGEPKGCRHTHRSFLHSTAGLSLWHGHTPDTVFLGVAPMYQIAGLVNSLNCAVYAGGTLVPLPRWDRTLAGQLIERYRITFAGLAPAAIADLLDNPGLSHYDLSSLTRISSGGSTMPKSLWDRVHATLGLPFIEVYGMTEAGTIAINPIERPKPQCLGVPFFNADVRIIDPDTFAPCATGEPGEIVVRGPQLFEGYWQRPQADIEAFVEIDGQRYFRTGDIGYADGEGYLFMTDRLKRMINAAGYKVWPAEVETILNQHPDVLEACVIAARDPRRGETVKALVVLRPGRDGRVQASDIVEWSRQRMAAFKYPRLVEFVPSLPKSPAGKVLWRELQERETPR
jgi:fatty-acyl-CoA synthase